MHTSKKKGLYFAHPMNTYNTLLEMRLLKAIEGQFREAEWYIINPNTGEHRRGFEKYALDYHNPMIYFSAEILPDCHGCVALPFEDGMWGAGVLKELFEVYVHDLPIWSIDTKGVMTKLPQVPFDKCLTIDQTVERIGQPYIYSQE